MPNIATFNFTIKQADTLRFPQSVGSMLRGAFGRALRELACQTDLPNCHICPMRQSCEYVQIFENQLLANDNKQIPNSYVLKLSSIKQSTIHQGQTWSFGMTLIGEAITAYPLVIRAWQLACQNGFGGISHRSGGELVKVMNQNQIVYLSSNPHTLTSAEPIKRISLLSPMRNIGKITLHFITPFRVQYQGKIAYYPHQFDPVNVLINLYNRIHSLSHSLDNNRQWQIGYTDFAAFKADIENITLTANVTSTKVVRHSSRQQQKIALFGLIGDIHLAADSEVLNRILPMLWLGQYVHVGKSTTHGMGQYQLQIR